MLRHDPYHIAWTRKYQACWNSVFTKPEVIDALLNLPDAFKVVMHDTVKNVFYDINNFRHNATSTILNRLTKDELKQLLDTGLLATNRYRCDITWNGSKQPSLVNAIFEVMPESLFVTINNTPHMVLNTFTTFVYLDNLTITGTPELVKRFNKGSKSVKMALVNSGSVFFDYTASTVSPLVEFKDIKTHKLLVYTEHGKLIPVSKTLLNERLRLQNNFI